MERIKWHATELNTPVAGMKTETAPTTNGPVKWGTTSIGTFVISCDSDLPEGETRAGRDYAVVLHERRRGAGHCGASQPQRCRRAVPRRDQAAATLVIILLR